MSDRDSRPIGGGASRRATRRGAHGDDAPQVAEGRDDKAFPSAGESKYPATASGRPAPEPLEVRIELVVVDGPDAKELLKRQAAVVREALQWFADNPPPKGEGRDTENWSGGVATVPARHLPVAAACRANRPREHRMPRQ